jgi:Family of unknown function (DUF6600)
MRRNVLAVLLGLLFLSSCVIYVPYEGEEGNPPPREPRTEKTYEGESEGYPVEMDYNGFYEYLSPYGTWVHSAPYGYVWIPGHVDRHWRPYTYGRWVWTNYGWTWLSYHEWGWVPFHYGRWGWDARLGWFWVPGSVWAPAWVSWRWGNVYIGWSPLPPDIELVAGVGIPPLPDDFPDIYWVFIDGRYFQYDYLDRYVLPFERNGSIVRLTVHKANLSVRSRQLINDGVDIDQVSRLTRSEVSRYEVEEGPRPGQSRISGNTVKIFRPAVTKNEAAKPKVFLEKEEAEKKAAEIRDEGFETRLSPAELEQNLREDQDKEIRLLEQSQERDEAELLKKADDEERLAESPAEKEKIKKEAVVKESELKKAHAEEKAKITERHKEEEKAVRSRIKKKEKDN